MSSRLPVLRSLLCCTFALHIGVRPIDAQVAPRDDAAIRRQAIENTIRSRAERRGVDLPMSLCSVVDAIGLVDAALGRSDALRGAVAGDTARARCELVSSFASLGPWRPYSDVIGVSILDRHDGMRVAAVSLRSWRTATSYADETYEFLVSADSIWTPFNVTDSCCETSHIAGVQSRLPAVVINERLMPAGSTLENALDTVKGQVIDSVRVLPVGDPRITAFWSASSANGAVIIGTHPTGRRP